MKKILICLFAILLTGCTVGGEEVSCTVNGKNEIYTLKDGLVKSLTIDGKKQSQANVDELNGTYFTSATNNEEALEILNDYINMQGGNCD